VDIVDEKEEVTVILSKAEKRPLYETQKAPMSDSHQKELTGHLNIYYDSVIARIRNAESIVIFGPD